MDGRKRKLNAKARQPKNKIQKCEVVKRDVTMEQKKVPLKTIFKRVRNGEDGSTIYVIKDANQTPMNSDVDIAANNATDVTLDGTNICSLIPHFTNEDIAELIGCTDLSLFINNYPPDDDAVYDVLALLQHPTSTPDDPHVKTEANIENNLLAESIESSEMNKPPRTTFTPQSHFLDGDAIKSSTEKIHNPASTPSSNSLHGGPLESSSVMNNPPRTTFTPQSHFLNGDAIKASPEKIHNPASTPSSNSLHGDPLESSSEKNKPPNSTLTPSSNSLLGGPVESSAEMNNPPRTTFTPQSHFLNGDAIKASPEKIHNPASTPSSNSLHGDPLESSSEKNKPPNSTLTPSSNYLLGGPVESSAEMNKPPRTTFTPQSHFLYGDAIKASPEKIHNPVSTPSSNSLHGGPLESSSVMNNPPRTTFTPQSHFLNGDAIKASPEKIHNPASTPSSNSLHGDPLESSSEKNKPPNSTLTPSSNYLLGGPVESSAEMNKPPRTTFTPQSHFLYGDAIKASPEKIHNPASTPSSNSLHGGPLESSSVMNNPPRTTFTPQSHFLYGDALKSSPEKNKPPNSTFPPSNNSLPTMQIVNSKSHSVCTAPNPTFRSFDESVTSATSYQFEFPMSNSAFTNDRMAYIEHTSANGCSSTSMDIKERRMVPKLPTKLLEEILGLQRFKPTYKLRSLSNSIIQCHVRFKHQHACGSANSIEGATNSAALSLLDKLISIKYFGNIVGRLQELCMTMPISWPLPKYSDEMTASYPCKNEKVFIVSCSVKHFREFGQGRNKNMAKIFAAYKMWCKLTGKI